MLAGLCLTTPIDGQRTVNLNSLGQRHGDSQVVWLIGGLLDRWREEQQRAFARLLPAAPPSLTLPLVGNSGSAAARSRQISETMKGSATIIIVVNW